MGYRIQAHPNPPYLKGDGTLNSNGQLKLWEAGGTSVAKDGFKDAAGTSYGAVIDLDSSGLPELGPIYWDDAALYNVEVYYSVDGTGSPYALDYAVDNFGELDAVTGSLMTATTAWTVDGVGGTSTTFATIAASMVEARKFIIMKADALTITVNNGVYLDEVIDFSHPQGQFISFVGESLAGAIIRSSVNNGYVLTFANDVKLKSFTNFTLEATSGAGNEGCWVAERAEIGTLSVDIPVNVGGGTNSIGLEVYGKVYAGTVTTDGYDNGLAILGKDGYCFLDSYTSSNNTSYGIIMQNNSYGYVTTLDIDGDLVTSTAGVTVQGTCTFKVHTTTLDTMTLGFQATGQGDITVLNAPTQTAVGTLYTPLKGVIGNVAGAGADYKALITAP